MFIDRIDLEITRYTNPQIGIPSQFTVRMHADLERTDAPLEAGKILAERLTTAANAMAVVIAENEPLTILPFTQAEEEPTLSPFTVVSDHCSCEGETD